MIIYFIHYFWLASITSYFLFIKLKSLSKYCMDSYPQQSDSKILFNQQQQEELPQKQQPKQSRTINQNPLMRLSSHHAHSTGDLNKIVVNPLHNQDEESRLNLSPSKRAESHSRYNESIMLNKNKRKLPPISKHVSREGMTILQIQQRKKISPEKQTQQPQPNIKQSYESNKFRNSITILPQAQKYKDQVIKILPNDPNFIYLPIMPGFILQGNVNRIRLNRKQAHNQYQFAVSESRQQILFAAPKACRSNSFYDIRMDGDTVATLQSNFSGSRFELKDAKLKNLLCTIEYQSNICSDAQTRVFKAMINRQNLMLETRLPTYNKSLKKYTLFFNKRANFSSLKNFILVEPQNERKNVVMLGKMNQDQFSLDVSAGVSPLQAFGIAISSFDPKLICE